MITKQRARELMRLTCIKNGFSSEYADHVGLEWNDRFTSTMGHGSHPYMLIRLSIPIYQRASVKDQEDTVVHEMCHIIAFEKFGYGIKTHGTEWKTCMLTAGYKPERCHSVDLTGLQRTRKTCPTLCGDIL